MAEIERSTPARGGGFSDAISKILSHTGVPRPKRIKREKQEDIDNKPIISTGAGDAVPISSEGGVDGTGDVKPKTTEKLPVRRKHLPVSSAESISDSQSVLLCCHVR